MRLCCTALALLLGLSVCACSRTAPSQPDRPPVWTATFEQDRPDQAFRNADVKLTNTGPREVTVDGVALRWSGYRHGRWQPADMTYAPGHVHRLDIRLPPPRCDGDREDRPRVAVRLVTGESHTAPLGTAGAALLRRLWEQDCAERRLLEAVHVALQGWRLERRAGGLVLRGDVAARRGSSPAEVALVETRGSVLLDFEMLGSDAVLLRRTADRGRVQVAVRSNGRCDPHSLGQSTQTFTLRLWLSLDGGPEQPVVMVPDARTRAWMQEVIADGCGLR